MVNEIEIVISHARFECIVWNKRKNIEPNA